MSERENILGIDSRKALLTILVAVVLAVGTVSLIGKLASFDDIARAGSSTC